MSSSSSSSPSPPPPPLSLSSNHPLPMRSRITPADVARAYMITPPPENNHEHHDNQVFSRCLLKINDNQYAFEARLETLERRAQEHGPTNLSQEWELERERHGRRRSTSELDFIHGQIETAMDPLEDKHTSLEQRLENIEDAAASQKGNMSDRFDELSGEIDAVEVSLSTQIKDLAKSTDLRFSEVTSQIDEVSSRLGDLEMRFINSRATMLNGLASRPNDIVTPLSTIQRDSTGQSVVTAIGPTGKMVKWWWKLRRPERYEKLLEYHKFLQLDFREWTGPDSDSDSESEDDDDDLDPQPLPKSLAEAIQKNQEKAVKILFGNMGLSYTNFDELFRRNYEPVPPPKRALSYQNQRSQRRVDPQGELRGPSYWGSPTVSIRGAGSPTAS